ncbi:MAG: PHP domain-containing protein, partial [Enhygromyxa sp.]
MRPYVPLTVKSNFSFLEGASHPHELVEQAVALGLPALGLCDRNGVYGVVRAHVAAKKLGLPLVLGAELNVGELPEELFASTPRSGGRKRKPVEARASVIVLAESRIGWARLCRLLSIAHTRGPKGQALLTLDELAGGVATGIYNEAANTPAPSEHVGDGLIALVRDPEHLPILAEAWGSDRVYGLITRHQQAEELAREDAMRRAGLRCSVPCVGGTDVLYHSPARRSLQDVLACVRAGTTLAEAGLTIQGNAEHALESIQAMRERFADAPELLDRTLEIAERCCVSGLPASTDPRFASVGTPMPSRGGQVSGLPASTDPRFA